MGRAADPAVAPPSDIVVCRLDSRHCRRARTHVYTYIHYAIYIYTIYCNSVPYLYTCLSPPFPIDHHIIRTKNTHTTRARERTTIYSVRAWVRLVRIWARRERRFDRGELGDIRCVPARS